ncbi:hypothetical protein M404DRAFT_22747 [Pisolithus tinctorius Marx 270]|uniref:Uncharacterized protein n=1 Tax=Pisolithus tinctorius Marx 270 TaxID=870435 RepID=A0A0C3PJZ3_PISTI|nr:hypothetical protein M404DRAFT_22747 [Pisolithus tinctorius Marx 270]
MAANHAPHLSQLIRAPTPDPMEAKKASLREQLAAASAGLVAEVKHVPDNWEDMWEKKTTWLRCWEEKMVGGSDASGQVREGSQGVCRWTAEEAEAHVKAEQDVQMGEETAVEVGDEGMEVKMSHVEVPQLVCKHLWQTVAESEDEAGPKVVILPGLVLHEVLGEECGVFRSRGSNMQWLHMYEAGVREVDKGHRKVGAGWHIMRSSKAPKASPSKWAHDDDDDDDDIVEVVESRTCGKGKASGCSAVSSKTATDLSQALTMVRAEAVATHAANLWLQVCIKQLAEVLAEHGIK